MLTLARGHKEVFAWDVANEPDRSAYSENPVPPAAREAKIEMGKKIADFVHRFDKNNLTTVGNESDDRVLEVPDQESWVTMPLQRSAKWLAAKEPGWEEGLEIAEIDANMVEGNQLALMRYPPTLAIQKLRAGPPDLPALRATMQQYVAILTPFAGLGRLHGN